MSPAERADLLVRLGRGEPRAWEEARALVAVPPPAPRFVALSGGDPLPVPAADASFCAVCSAEAYGRELCGPCREDDLLEAASL